LAQHPDQYGPAANPYRLRNLPIAGLGHQRQLGRSSLADSRGAEFSARGSFPPLSWFVFFLPRAEFPQCTLDARNSRRVTTDFVFARAWAIFRSRFGSDLL
jgi:hypothetical protein